MSDKELMQEALKWQEHIKQLASDHAEDELYQKRSKVFDWLIEQSEKAEKYREALEFYADKSNWVTYEGTVETFCGEIARKALEGEENDG